MIGHHPPRARTRSCECRSQPRSPGRRRALREIGHALVELAGAGRARRAGRPCRARGGSRPSAYSRSLASLPLRPSGPPRAASIAASIAFRAARRDRGSARRSRPTATARSTATPVRACWAGGRIRCHSDRAGAERRASRASARRARRRATRTSAATTVARPSQAAASPRSGRASRLRRPVSAAAAAIGIDAVAPERGGRSPSSRRRRAPDRRPAAGDPTATRRRIGRAGALRRPRVGRDARRAGPPSRVQRPSADASPDANASASGRSSGRTARAAPTMSSNAGPRSGARDDTGGATGARHARPARPSRRPAGPIARSARRMRRRRGRYTSAAGGRPLAGQDLGREIRERPDGRPGRR